MRKFETNGAKAMKYLRPTITSTRRIMQEVKSITSNKADPRVIDNPATQTLGSSAGYEADE